MRTKALCELLPVVSLYTFNWTGENLDKVFKKQAGGIETMLLKSLNETPSGIFINGSVLIEALPCDSFTRHREGTNLTSI